MSTTEVIKEQVEPVDLPPEPEPPAEDNVTGRLPERPDVVVIPEAAESSKPKAAPATPRPTYPKRSSKPKQPPSFLTGILLGLLTGLLLTSIVAVVLFLGFRAEARAAQQRAQQAEQRVTALADEVDTLHSELSALEGRAEQLEALPPRLAELAQGGELMGERLEEMGETVTSMGSEVEAMGETVTGMEQRLGTLQERAQAFDAFLLGLRDLSLRANPLPQSTESATPSSPTLLLTPGSIRQGEEMLLTAEALEPETRYDIALINERGEETLLGQARSTTRGQLRFQLRANESLDITPGRYTIALYPEDGAELVANAELRVTAR